LPGGGGGGVGRGGGVPRFKRIRGGRRRGRGVGQADVAEAVLLFDNAPQIEVKRSHVHQQRVNIQRQQPQPQRIGPVNHAPPFRKRRDITFFVGIAGLCIQRIVHQAHRNQRFIGVALKSGADAFIGAHQRGVHVQGFVSRTQQLQAADF
jgi:hypothetical protein